MGEVLAELPEHPLAVAVNGLLSLAAEGYPAAMRPLYRAFQIAVRRPAAPDVATGDRSGPVADGQGAFLAARQYLSWRCAFDPENQEAVEAYLAFIRDARIPYPLRDGYALAPLAGNDNFKPQFDQALKLAVAGMFQRCGESVWRRRPARSQAGGLMVEYRLVPRLGRRRPAGSRSFQGGSGQPA